MNKDVWVTSNNIQNHSNLLSPPKWIMSPAFNPRWILSEKLCRSWLSWFARSRRESSALPPPGYPMSAQASARHHWECCHSMQLPGSEDTPRNPQNPSLARTRGLPEDLLRPPLGFGSTCRVFNVKGQVIQYNNFPRK